MKVGARGRALRVWPDPSVTKSCAEDPCGAIPSVQASRAQRRPGDVVEPIRGPLGVGAGEHSFGFAIDDVAARTGRERDRRAGDRARRPGVSSPTEPAVLAPVPEDSTSPRVYTYDELELFDVLTSPVWIVDFERGGRSWVNAACLPLWNAASREELLARPTEPPSATSRTRLDALRRRLERGLRSVDRWTIYPDGAPPFVADCRSSGILVAARPGEPGALAMLIEARLVGPDEQDPLERRSVEALRYLGELVSFYAETGEALMRNPAAVRALGDPGPGDQFAAGFVDAAQAAEARARLAARAPYRADTLLRTLAGERWFETEARPALDPMTGRPAVLVTQRDVAERRAHLEQISAQAEALRRLAAPVMRVGAGVYALPLIGALDRDRVDVALAALHARAASEPVRRVVLDLTGAAAVDAAVAAELLRVARVLRLQGVTLALTGIRPDLARAAAGLDLAGVACFSTLADALRG